MALRDELERAAEAAAPFAEGGEELAGVVAVEARPGERMYLCAYEAHGSHTWLVLDAAGAPVESRAAVRETASVAALCELAEESAGGGELDDLRSRLVALRLTENPPGIDEAEEAVLVLQRALGAPPRVATLAYLDDVSAATRRLEQALGGAQGSPFAEAMKAASGSVERLTADVEANYKRPLA